MRLVLVALMFAALPAYGGSFPVCIERAQYARIELVDAFGPTQCVVEAANINPLLGLLAGAALVTGTFVLARKLEAAKPQNENEE